MPKKGRGGGRKRPPPAAAAAAASEKKKWKDVENFEQLFEFRTKRKKRDDEVGDLAADLEGILDPESVVYGDEIGGVKVATREEEKKRTEERKAYSSAKMSGSLGPNPKQEAGLKAMEKRLSKPRPAAAVAAAAAAAAPAREEEDKIDRDLMNWALQPLEGEEEDVRPPPLPGTPPSLRRRSLRDYGTPVPVDQDPVEESETEPPVPRRRRYPPTPVKPVTAEAAAAAGGIPVAPRRQVIVISDDDDDDDEDDTEEVVREAALAEPVVMPAEDAPASALIDTEPDLDAILGSMVLPVFPSAAAAAAAAAAPPESPPPLEPATQLPYDAETQRPDEYSDDDNQTQTQVDDTVETQRPEGLGSDNDDDETHVGASTRIKVEEEKEVERMSSSIRQWRPFANKAPQVRPRRTNRAM